MKYPVSLTLLLALCFLLPIAQSAIVQCPFSSKCKCDQDTSQKNVFLSVNCTTTVDDKETIPSFTAPPGTRYSVNGSMTLSYYDATLPSNQFVAFSSIGQLTVNQLYKSKMYCDDGAYAGVTIKELIVSGFLNYFPLPACLQRLGSGGGLQKLTIPDAYTYKLVDNSFPGFTTLTSLTLGGVDDFSDRAFDGLGGSLSVFSATGGSLTRIPQASLSVLSKLGQLELSKNRIDALRTDDFLKLSNLQALNLDGNPIASIDSGAFEGNGMVGLVSMVGTGMKELDLALFGGMNERVVVRSGSSSSLVTVGVSNLEQFPDQSNIDLSNSALQTVNSSIGDLLARYPNITIDIRNNVNLECTGLDWMATAAMCTQQLLVDNAVCRDGSSKVALIDYLKKVSSANLCDPITMTMVFTNSTFEPTTMSGNTTASGTGGLTAINGMLIGFILLGTILGT